MGGYNQKEFTKDFFMRTKHNLDLYNIKHDSGDEEFKYETTQLINSFLGLIVFVKADGIATNNALNHFMNVNPASDWEYRFPNSTKSERKNFGSYLRHIRNAIAHSGIKANTSSMNEIVSLEFADQDPDNNPKRNPDNIFRLKLTLEEIQDLINLLYDVIENSNSNIDSPKDTNNNNTAQGIGSFQQGDSE